MRENLELLLVDQHAAVSACLAVIGWTLQCWMTPWHTSAIKVLLTLLNLLGELDAITAFNAVMPVRSAQALHACDFVRIAVRSMNAAATNEGAQSFFLEDLYATNYYENDTKEIVKMWWWMPRSFPLITQPFECSSHHQPTHPPPVSSSSHIHAITTKIHLATMRRHTKTAVASVVMMMVHPQLSER